jgi:hypothetical protein
MITPSGGRLTVSCTGNGRPAPEASAVGREPRVNSRFFAPRPGDVQGAGPSRRSPLNDSRWGWATFSLRGINAPGLSARNGNRLDGRPA